MPDCTKCCSLASLTYRWFSLTPHLYVATIDEAQDGENVENHISLAKMLEVNQEVSTAKSNSVRGSQSCKIICTT